MSLGPEKDEEDHSTWRDLPSSVVDMILQFAADSPSWLRISRRLSKTPGVLSRSVWSGWAERMLPGLVPPKGIPKGVRCVLQMAPESWIGPTCYLDGVVARSGEIVVGRDGFGRGFFVCKVRNTVTGRIHTPIIFQRYSDSDRLWCFAGNDRPSHTVVDSGDVAKLRELLTGRAVGSLLNHHQGPYILE